MASHNQLISPQGPQFLVHAIQLKPTIKAQITGRMVSSALAFTSVYSEKIHQKKLMIMIIIMKKTCKK